MARKRKKIARKKDKTPQPSIEEYARSTANLIVSMCKMAGENDCVDPAFLAFRNQIEDVLDEHQRDLIESLFYECYQDLQQIRGEVQGGNKSTPDTNADIGAPEPVPKKTKTIEYPWRPCGEVCGEVKTNIATAFNKVGVPISTPRTITDDDVDRTLYGYGVKESEAPGQARIDYLLEKGIFTKQDITNKTGYHKDTVRKRITFIKKGIPEVFIEYQDNPNPNGGPSILKAVLKSPSKQ